MSATTLTGRLNNKYLKQQHDIMLSFGYTLTGWSHRSGGHPRYTQEGFDRLELSSTPRSEKGARSRLLNELRKRHPEHPRWRSSLKSHRRPGRRRNRPPRTLRHLTDVSQPIEPAVAEKPAPVAPPVPVWAATDPICPARRDEWRRKAEELARLNAEERLRPRRAAA